MDHRGREGGAAAVNARSWSMEVAYYATSNRVRRMMMQHVVDLLSRTPVSITQTVEPALPLENKRED